MKITRHLRTSRTGTWLIATVSLLAIGSAFAQRDRIAHAVDSYRNVIIRGHLNPQAKAAYDQGPVNPGFLMHGMTLAVRRTAAQQKDLDQLLVAQQNPSSPSYHKWLTPEGFAKRFGASPSDLATLREWLEGKGFQIKAVARGGTFIRFDATAAQVRNAFGTEIHQYAVKGVKHYANVSEPALPATIAPLVRAVGGMNDFGPLPNHVTLAKSATKVKAHYTDSDSGNNELAPGDLATIYDIGPLQTASGVAYGLGETVVVIGASDVNAADLTAYCGNFNLASFGCGASFSQVFPAGDGDPGLASGDAIGSLMEATMDVEVVSAVAPGAAVILDADANIWNALSDAVDNRLGQVILMSFGQCETAGDPSLPGTIQGYAQEANSQGMTVVAASGNSGGAGCDAAPITAAAGGLAVTLPAAIPEVTGVGGTEFTDQSSASWGTASSTGGTALNYIPENSWDDTFNGGLFVAATGGGVSTIFGTPSWQSATAGVVSTGRNVPDVALSASVLNDPYVSVVTMDTGDGLQQQTIPNGGTAASAAAFAGMVALINASQGASAATGNINPALYSMAGATNGYSGLNPPFHAIVAGGNQVPCAPGPNCPESGVIGYPYASGYDQATGLGSVDAWNLQQSWPAPSAVITSFSPSSVTAGGDAFTLTVNGSGFNPAAVILWNGTPLATTVVNSGQITVQVSSGMIANSGSAAVAVLNNDGTTSAPSSFPINAQPTASISNLMPSSATAGATGFTLTVSGTGFVAGAKVVWNATQLSTTVVSGTQLTAPVIASMVAVSGSASVTVINGDSTTSAPSTFTISSAPAISGLTPNAATAGHGDLLVSIAGTGFAAGDTIYWALNSGTSALIAGSSCVSSPCSVTLPQVSLATAGAGHITVVTADGAISAAATFTINATPAIGDLSPNSATAGHGDLLVSITGTGFASGSTVYWAFNSGAAALITGSSCVSSPCSVTVPQASLATAGAGHISVVSADGVTSAPVTFTINAAPVIGTLSPNSATAGHGDLLVSITGTGFASGSTVYWAFNSGAAALIAGSSCVSSPCSVTVPQASMLTAGTGHITVVSADGVSSMPATFTVAPVPAISSITGIATAGNASGAALTISGTGFTAGNSLSWKFWGTTTPLNGLSCPSSPCSVTIPANLLSKAGNASISVISVDGISSVAFPFTIASAPAIAWVSPSKATAGRSDFPVTITGTGFTSGSVVKWNAGSTSVASSYNSPTSLSATIPAADLATVGSGQITVVSADGVSSAGFTLNIVDAPTVISLTPSKATAGFSNTAGAVLMTIAGTNFTAGSTVKWNTQVLTSWYASQFSLLASVPTTYLATAGTAAITVVSADGVSTVSAAGSTFTINAIPIITSLAPATATAGSGSAVSLTVGGTGFASGSTVTWKGRNTPLAGSCPSLTSCTVTVPASDLATSGLAPISVRTADGVSSSPMNFSVASATITGFTPNYAPVNGNSFALTVNGTGFAPGATILWNKLSVPTAFVSPTELTGSIASGKIPGIPGSVPVAVVNADATTSVASNFTITPTNAPAITSVAPASAAAGAATTTLSIKGVNFTAGTGSGKTFVPGSLVYFDGSATGMTVTAGTTTSITATISSTLLTTAGVQSLTVVNSGVASAASTFMVNSPAIASITPNMIAAGSGNTTVVVAGANFIAGSGSGKTFVPQSVVYLNGAGISSPIELTPTAGTASSITVSIPSTNLASTGELFLRVQNPGGAQSSAAIVAVGAPTLASLTPASAIAGSVTVAAPLLVTVAGTNFVSGSAVYFGSETSPLKTTYVSATSLKTYLTPTELATAGTYTLTVQNASGVVSSWGSFTVGGPTITSLSPTSAAAATSFKLTVNGTNFVAKISTITWGSTALTTTCTATQCTATAPATSAGPVSVSVQNGTAMPLAYAAFSVGALVPSSANAGSSGFTMTVNGTGFSSKSVVNWGSTPTALTTSYVSATQVTATVAAGQLAASGPQAVTVKTGTVTFTAGTFTVNPPTISLLSPALAAAGSVTGSATLTLTVTGTDFVSGSTVYWGTTLLNAHAGSTATDTQIVVDVTAAELAASGPQNVTVQNGSINAASTASVFNVNPPTIGSLGPSSAVAGDTPFTLTVTGTNFVSGSTVYWGSTLLTAHSGSTPTATQLMVDVTSAQLSTAGQFNITVQNGSINAVSTATSFTVSAAPTLTGLSLSSATHAGASFPLIVTGTNFASGSTVMFGSVSLTPTGTPSATSLTVTVPASAIANTGSINVTVVGPGGATTATSPASTFTVD